MRNNSKHDEEKKKKKKTKKKTCIQPLFAKISYKNAKKFKNFYSHLELFPLYFFFNCYLSPSICIAKESVCNCLLVDDKGEAKKEENTKTLW